MRAAAPLTSKLRVFTAESGQAVVRRLTPSPVPTTSGAAKNCGELCLEIMIKNTLLWKVPVYNLGHECPAKGCCKCWDCFFTPVSAFFFFLNWSVFSVLNTIFKLGAGDRRSDVRRCPLDISEESYRKCVCAVNIESCVFDRGVLFNLQKLVVLLNTA